MTTKNTIRLCKNIYNYSNVIIFTSWLLLASSVTVARVNISVIFYSILPFLIYLLQSHSYCRCISVAPFFVCWLISMHVLVAVLDPIDFLALIQTFILQGQVCPFSLVSFSCPLLLLFPIIHSFYYFLLL